ncbi:MAG: hypothetical protein HYV63_31130 [Candidatus Schekmanbacteria bacterium]|nr:hypothetical protein [Candidatus Schekmanbacteria bacterium]
MTHRIAASLAATAAIAALCATPGRADSLDALSLSAAASSTVELFAAAGAGVEAVRATAVAESRFTSLEAILNDLAAIFGTPALPTETPDCVTIARTPGSGHTVTLEDCQVGDVTVDALGAVSYGAGAASLELDVDATGSSGTLSFSVAMDWADIRAEPRPEVTVSELAATADNLSGDTGTVTFTVDSLSISVAGVPAREAHVSIPDRGLHAVWNAEPKSLDLGLQLDILGGAAVSGRAEGHYEDTSIGLDVELTGATLSGTPDELAVMAELGAASPKYVADLGQVAVTVRADGTYEGTLAATLSSDAATVTTGDGFSIAGDDTETSFMGPIAVDISALSIAGQANKVTLRYADDLPHAGDLTLAALASWKEATLYRDQEATFFAAHTPVDGYASVHHTEDIVSGDDTVIFGVEDAWYCRDLRSGAEYESSEDDSCEQ